jgi:pyrimidine oxygenase
MEFGVFLPVVENGYIVSLTSPQFKPTFELNKRAAQQAEEAGFTFALSQATWRGWTEESPQWESVVESLTMTAGLVRETERLKYYASVAVLTIPPAVVAKMAATIDDMSDGRFGLNIVSGYNKPQYDQMGLWPGDEFFNTRYDYATEYVRILRELWDTGKSDFKGKHFQLNDTRMGPTPKHTIELVCAGSSDRGIEFVAEYGDYSFVMPAGGIEGVQAQNERLKQATAKSGRDVKSMVVRFVILGDTDEEAQEKIDRYKAGADMPALMSMAGIGGLDAEGTTAARISELRESVFYGNPLVAGSPQTVAAYMDEMAKDDMTAGCMLIVDDYENGIERFGREVMPLMESRVPTAR